MKSMKPALMAFTVLAASGAWAKTPNQKPVTKQQMDKAVTQLRQEVAKAEAAKAAQEIAAQKAEAARVALEAGVGRLALIHCVEQRQAAALEAARALFPNTFWPADGEEVLLGAGTA